MIAILDYGAGNLRSVQNTLEEIGAQYTLVADAAGISRASKVILPGVGHFGQMMRTLDAHGLRGSLRDAASGSTPFLGICLGLQALFEGSDEAPDVAGLGIFPGRVRRFPEWARCPQMGWNNLQLARASRLISGSPYVYFANSFYCPVTEATAATATYADLDFTAVLEQRNVFGVQFHPEKSGPAGLDMMRRFVEC